MYSLNTKIIFGKLDSEPDIDKQKNKKVFHYFFDGPDRKIETSGNWDQLWF